MFTGTRQQEDLLALWRASPRVWMLMAYRVPGPSRRGSREPTPKRTVYNAQTRQYEELPLTEFQQLLLQGKIQATIVWSEPPETRYRIV